MLTLRKGPTSLPRAQCPPATGRGGRKGQAIREQAGGEAGQQGNRRNHARTRGKYPIQA